MINLAPETRAAGSCILVVDDDHGVRENLAELFELVGYSVLTAANAGSRRWTSSSPTTGCLARTGWS